MPKFFLKEFLFFSFQQGKVREAAHSYQSALQKFPGDELKTFKQLRVCVLLNLSRCRRKMNVRLFLTHTHVENILLIILKQISSRKLYFSIDISLIFLTGLQPCWGVCYQGPGAKSQILWSFLCQSPCQTQPQVNSVVRNWIKLTDRHLLRVWVLWIFSSRTVMILLFDIFKLFET